MKASLLVLWQLALWVRPATGQVSVRLQRSEIDDAGFSTRVLTQQLQWTLVTPGQNCNNVCTTPPYDNQRTKFIRTASQFDDALESAGASVTCFSDSVVPNNDLGPSPFIDENYVCQYAPSGSNSGSGGGTSDPNYRRLCCCGGQALCPITCTTSGECEDDNTPGKSWGFQ